MAPLVIHFGDGVAITQFSIVQSAEQQATTVFMANSRTSWHRQSTCNQMKSRILFLIWIFSELLLNNQRVREAVGGAIVNYTKCYAMTA